jgi:hypothetical protein
MNKSSVLTTIEDFSSYIRSLWRHVSATDKEIDQSTYLTIVTALFGIVRRRLIDNPLYNAVQPSLAIIFLVVFMIPRCKWVLTSEEAAKSSRWVCSRVLITSCGYVATDAAIFARPEQKIKDPKPRGTSGSSSGEITISDFMTPLGWNWETHVPTAWVVRREGTARRHAKCRGDLGVGRDRKLLCLLFDRSCEQRRKYDDILFHLWTGSKAVHKHRVKPPCSAER